MPFRIGVVVGEPSGDKLAASLIYALRAYQPDIEIEGVIGPEMIATGACQQLFPMHKLSVMGFIEPLKQLPELLKMRRWLARYFQENPPDLFIGVDAPEFNLGLELQLRKAGIPVVHYVSPSVWAWRQGRIKVIKRAVDLMLTLFPFEEKFYQQHQVNAKYIGHPAADRIPDHVDTKQARLDLDITTKNKLIGLLPGSRTGEIKVMGPLYLNVAKHLSVKDPNLQFIVPLVSKMHLSHLQKIKDQFYPEVPIHFVLQQPELAMAAVDIAIVTSGTATLEMMLYKKPMIVAYKTNFLTYHIVKRLIKIPYIALPNIIAGEKIIPEYIQRDATVTNLTDALECLIYNENLQQTQIKAFQNMSGILRCNATKHATDAVIHLLGV